MLYEDHAERDPESEHPAMAGRAQEAEDFISGFLDFVPSLVSHVSMP